MVARASTVGIPRLRTNGYEGDGDGDGEDGGRVRVRNGISNALRVVCGPFGPQAIWVSITSVKYDFCVRHCHQSIGRSPAPA